MINKKFKLTQVNPNINGVYFTNYEEAINTFFLNKQQPLYSNFGSSDSTHIEIGTMIGFNKENNEIIVKMEDSLQFITPDEYEVGFLFNVNCIDESKKLYEIVSVIYASLVPINK